MEDIQLRKYYGSGGIGSLKTGDETNKRLLFKGHLIIISQQCHQSFPNFHNPVPGYLKAGRLYVDTPSAN